MAMEQQAREAELAKNRLAALRTEIQTEQQAIAQLEKLLHSRLPWVFLSNPARREIGYVGQVASLVAFGLAFMLPLLLLLKIDWFWNNNRVSVQLLVAMLVLLLPAAVVLFTVRLWFGRKSIHAKLQGHTRRIVELENEGRAISGRTVASSWR